MSLDGNLSHEATLNKFVEFFKNDLTDYIHNKSHKPKFRSVVVGGYGLKLLLENKYGMKDKVKTRDLDITLSSYRSLYTDEQITTHIMSKLVGFIRNQPNPMDFKVSIIQGSLYVPVLDYTRTAIIMVTYKYEDFVDIAVTNAKIIKSNIDKKYSIKCGLPLKTINDYLIELLTIIYRSNVLNVAPEVYSKRNPVSGFQSQKGVRDIERSKLICTLPRLKKFQAQCNFINSISITMLFLTTPETRSKFFSALESLLNLRRQITRKALTIDKNNSQKILI